MNVLIPYINSPWGGTELRYAIRGLCKHMQDMGDLWVIGDCPEWLVPDVHILYADHPDRRFKERNIKSKIELAITQGIGSSFLFGNDDHFMLKDFTGKDYPLQHNGDLRASGRGAYQQSTANTIEVLKGMGATCLNYDIHCPIVYHSEMFLTAMRKVDWNTPYGYVIKSLYSNAMGFSGVYISDMKINSQRGYIALKRGIIGRPWFSIGEKSMGLPMRKVLQELYSEPSKYEKDI